MVDHLAWRALPQRVPGNAHCVDPARRQDRRADMLFIESAGNLFNDPPKDTVPEVRVGPVLPGRMSQWKIPESPADQPRVAPGLEPEHGIRGIVRPATARMGQQMINGEVSDVRLEWRLSEFSPQNAGIPKHPV